MEKKFIDSENWTYSWYENKNLKACVSIGGEMKKAANGPSEPSILYFVSMLDGNGKDLFSRTFQSLTEACWYLNEAYGNWEIINGTKSEKEGSCSSCVAH